MTCKYFDSGWCYAPENVETNSVQGGCFEPEYCSYLTENKTLMTEKEHLECEIKELELEIEGHNKAIQNLINFQNRRKQKLKEMNYAEKRKERIINDNWKVETMNANYPMLEVIDENTVKIEGVEYKKVIPPTLHKILHQKTEIYPKVCGEICDVVRGWLIDHTVIETEDAERVTFTIHKEQLQTPK